MRNTVFLALTMLVASAVGHRLPLLSSILSPLTEPFLHPRRGPPAALSRPSSCSPSMGPFIMHPDCGAGHPDILEKDGIGARLNYLKIGVAYSLLLNLTYIPTMGCVWCGHHAGPAFRSLFEFDTGSACSEKDIQSMLSSGSLTAIDFQHEVGRPGPAMAQALTLLRTGAEGDSLPVSNTSATYAKGSFLDTFFHSFSQASPNTVFRLRTAPPGPIVEDYAAPLSLWFQSKYMHAFHRQHRSLPHYADVHADPDTGVRPLIVAVHIRRGDAFVDPIRITPFSYFVSVLSHISEAVGGRASVQVFIFSEGSPGDFTDITTKYPHATLVLGSKNSLISDLDHMIHSDVLVTSKSSFSQLAAVLNPNGVKIVLPYWVPFDGITKVLTSSPDGSFNSQEFQKLLNV